MTDCIRVRAHECDFLIRKRRKTGWSIYVRKSLDGERVLLGVRRSARDAESYAMDWAQQENVRKKDGRPSQLQVPRASRIVIAPERFVIEEE